MRRMSAAVFLCAAFSLAAAPGHAQATYRRAVVDQYDRLHVTTSTGLTISPAMDSDQVGFAQPAIAPDGRSVGWLALYPNCCTTYPIPLRLVVRTAGKDRAFDGNGLAIGERAFVDGGRRVALSQAPLHGAVTVHYALYDLASGRLLRTFDRPTDRDADTTASRANSGGAIPAWVRRAFPTATGSTP